MGAATSCRAGYASGHGLDKLRALFLRVKLRLELRFQVQLLPPLVRIELIPLVLRHMSKRSCKDFFCRFASSVE